MVVRKMNSLVGKFFVIKNTTVTLLSDLLTVLISYYYLLIFNFSILNTSLYMYFLPL